ncbi:MAG: DUF1329 domain-containing protein [Deltaproteobacteria bacterium]|nr:DUF1329 domain-containing protein [Deltaproteobacteria bacterium]
MASSPPSQLPDRCLGLELGGALVALLLTLALPGPARAQVPWTLPPADSCKPQEGLKGWPLGEDAPPVSFHKGSTFSVDQLPLLRDYFPPQLWKERERFFYEGMRLEIGACFADYGSPEFFTQATEHFRGKPHLLEGGGLGDYSAGLPFPSDTIDPKGAQAGLKWAWNHALRYTAAGFRGNFRVSDMVGRIGRAEPFEGEIFKMQLSFRTDRADAKYKAKQARDTEWVAGGKMLEPFAAREHAWRQYRDTDAISDADRSDDLHAYLPDLRRVRRMNGANIPGIYMPSFSVGVQQATSVLGIGTVPGDLGSQTPDTITTKRSGFEGIVLRPLLSSWTYLGIQDVLTPINAASPMYPTVKDRAFGIWGLSFASDRWDLRRAIVLEGRAVKSVGAGETARMIIYIDLQTLVPLYYLSWDSQDEALDVGMYVGRWSEEREDYPRWPDDPKRPVRVIDPVGASFANLADVGGWRRETWEMVSTPPDDRVVRNMMSVSNLTKGR